MITEKQNGASPTSDPAVGSSDLLGPWVVEWSEKQHQFHVEQAASRFKDNVILHFMQHKVRYEWMTLAVCGTYEEANEFLRRMAQLRGLEWDDERIKWRES